MERKPRRAGAQGSPSSKTASSRATVSNKKRLQAPVPGSDVVGVTLALRQRVGAFEQLRRHKINELFLQAPSKPGHTCGPSTKAHVPHH